MYCDHSFARAKKREIILRMQNIDVMLFTELAEFNTVSVYGTIAFKIYYPVSVKVLGSIDSGAYE